MNGIPSSTLGQPERRRFRSAHAQIVQRLLREIESVCGPADAPGPVFRDGGAAARALEREIDLIAPGGEAADSHAGSGGSDPRTENEALPDADPEIRNVVDVVDRVLGAARAAAGGSSAGPAPAHDPRPAAPRPAHHVELIGSFTDAEAVHDEHDARREAAKAAHPAEALPERKAGRSSPATPEWPLEIDSAASPAPANSAPADEVELAGVFDDARSVLAETANPIEETATSPARVADAPDSGPMVVAPVPAELPSVEPDSPTFAAEAVTMAGRTLETAASSDTASAAAAVAATIELPANPAARESVDRQPSALSAALREADGSLAEDVETLLAGNFDTVSEVLEDDFCNPGDAAAIVNALDSAMSETTGAPAHQSPAMETAAAAEVGPMLLPERAGDAEDDFTTRGLNESSPVDPVAAELPEAAPLNAPRQPRPAASESPDLAAGDELREPPVYSALLAHATPAVVILLSMLATPLRFVPASLRPLVDWLALSLVFWVPIVWMITFFAIG